MAIKTAKISKQGNEYTVVSPDGVTKYKDAGEAFAALNAYNEAQELLAQQAEEPKGTHAKAAKGKLVVYSAGLGFQGMLFGGYVADWAAMLDFFASPADSPARRAFEASKAKLLPNWEAYSDLPIGATLPDGSVKTAARGRKA